jgi:6-phosphogluconate dehydrogenase
MHIGLVGLGRMGANMRDRLRAAGVQVTGFDQNPDVSDVGSLTDLVDALGADGAPRVVWVMVPAGEITEAVISDVAALLTSGDVVIDGGNSYFKDDLRRGAELGERGISYVDAGVSGGIWGKDNGYGLMVGGPDDVIASLMPVFDALRPEGPREEGFVHAGPVGAGHFAKMVHNGIEYGVMQAYAEGYEILAAREDLVTDVSSVFQAWQRGTVVRSWLLELLVKALNDDDDLSEIKGYVADSGEGRWTVQEAIDLAVPAPVISASLFARFDSRQADSPAMKAVAALREQFGGHAVKRSADG